MPALSPQTDQHYVFLKLPEGSADLPKWEVGELWVDLYAVLEINPKASTAEVEEAILNRGSHYLSFAFTRGAKPELVSIIERFLHDFRPVLLNTENRRRYDELLARYARGETGLPDYPEFLETLKPAQSSKAGGCLTMLIFMIGLGQMMFRMRYC